MLVKYDRLIHSRSGFAYTRVHGDSFSKVTYVTYSLFRFNLLKIAS